MAQTTMLLLTKSRVLCHAAVQTVYIYWQRAALFLFQMAFLEVLCCAGSHALGWIAVWQWSVVLDSSIMFSHAVLKMKKNHEASTSYDFSL